MQKVCLAGMLSVLAVSSLFVAIWYAQGGRILSVQTASMIPVFTPGDGVIIRPVATTQLRVGQVISYQRSPRSIIISHRIIAIQPRPAAIITKGDNLSQPDASVPVDRIIGQVVAVAPKYGRAVRWLRSPWGLITGIYIPASLVIGGEVLRYNRWRPHCHYTV